MANFLNTLQASLTNTADAIRTNEYRLMYFFGVWHTDTTLYAESDDEAIFDADEAYKDNARLQNWNYNVALFCGNRKVKAY